MSNPLNFDLAMLLKQGLALHQTGRLSHAEAVYRQVLNASPTHLQALHLLGTIQYQRGNYKEAIHQFGLALQIRPDHAPTHDCRGNALRKLNHFHDALASYDRAIALEPTFAVAFNDRGIVLQALNRRKEALASYNRAIAFRPDFAEAFNRRGNLLRQMGRFHDALASYHRAIDLKPNYAEVFSNRGVAFAALGRLRKALTSIERALALRPDYDIGFNNRGNVLHSLGRLNEAMASYKRALALKPDFPEAHFNLGGILSAQGFTDEAVAHYDRALTHKPSLAHARLAACVGQLPILYMDEAEILRRRAAYETRLRALSDEMDRGSIPDDWLAPFRPFYLPYQGYNDRDLQSRYGSLVCRIMAKHYRRAALTAPPQPDEPVRVGIVSGFFRNHASFNIPTKGWLTQLDRQRFRIFGYHTARQQDAETNTAANLCDVFVNGPLPIDAWRTRIQADALHVLIYPEIGMDYVSAALAAQRLAPVQCSSWGHPETSGFPTIDYFLSSELMEPPDGDNHYTERLIRLPNLSTYLEPVAAPSISLSRAELGLRQSATVYWCGQSLFKYLPQFDHVFPSIAREAGDCQFCFIRFYQGEHVTSMFQKRLDRAFAAFGLRAAEHCVFWPILGADRYIPAIERCDIALDSIGWSGCNTTLSTVAHNLPVVTIPGPLMRARHSMAFLKMMGVTETIVGNVGGYIATAVRLAGDVPWRMAIKAKIAENKHRIYRDRHSILALEGFLDRVGRGERM